MNNNKTLIKIDRTIAFDNPVHTQVEGKHNIYLVGNAALVVGCEMAETTIYSDENMFMVAEITTGEDGKKVITADVFCTEKQLARQRALFNLGDEKPQSLSELTVNLPRRGGYRPGAGRPKKLEDRLVSKSITLTQEQWDLIDPSGENYSQRLRDLLEIVQKIRQRPA